MKEQLEPQNRINHADNLQHAHNIRYGGVWYIHGEGQHPKPHVLKDEAVRARRSMRRTPKV